MKIRYLKLNTLAIAASVFAPAALFAQTATTATTPEAPAAAPVVETASATGSGGSWKFSADYFHFAAKAGIIQTVSDLYGGNYVYPQKDRKGNVYGGTVTFEKGKWGLDFQYHSGSDRLDLPNHAQTPGTGTGTGLGYFVDTFDFKTKSYNLNLRYKFKPTVYASIGAYQTTTDQVYFYENTDSNYQIGTGSVITQGTGLTGRGTQTFGSVGFGFASAYPIKDSSWTFAPKLELLFLAGKDTTPKGTQTTSTGDKTKTIYGAEGTGTLQLAYTTAKSAAFALEVGYKYSGFGDKTSSISDQHGLFAKLSIRFAY